MPLFYVGVISFMNIGGSHGQFEHFFCFYSLQLSQSSCKHLPGFRKILPRATCFLLPNGNSLTHQPGGGLSVKSENVPEACSPSTSVTSEVQFLSPEVELTEHHIVTEEATEETAAVPYFTFLLRDSSSFQSELLHRQTSMSHRALLTSQWVEWPSKEMRPSLWTAATTRGKLHRWSQSYPHR